MAIEGKFTRGPEITVDLDHKGVTGRVKLVFTSGDHCSVSCDGYINVPDSDRVTYRGKDYLPHVHVYRLSGDDEVIVWGIDEKRSYGHFGLDGVAKTFKAAIIAAIVAAVQEHGTQEVINQATYAEAMTDLSRADEEARDLESKLSAARGEQVRLRTLVARYGHRPRYSAPEEPAQLRPSSSRFQPKD